MINKDALKRELRKLNELLPAAVYIPFCQDSIRNFAVLHIPPEEVSVFQTKTRCPYMITIEVYRPDELSIPSNSHLGTSVASKKSKRKRAQELREFEEPLIVENSEDMFKLKRGKSNSVYDKLTNSIDVDADKKISNPLFISISKKPDVRRT